MIGCIYNLILISGIMAVCLTAMTVAADADEPMMQDIPKPVADYIGKRCMLKILPHAQAMLIIDYLNDADTHLTTSEKTELKRFLQLSDVDILQSSAVDSDYEETVYLEKFRFWLYDPRRLAAEVDQLEQVIQNDICKKVRLKTGTSGDKMIEWHNYLVFYLRNVHGICGDTLQWKPSGKYYFISDLYNSVGQSESVYKTLRDYFLDARNRPFQLSDNYSMTTYFYYLLLSYEQKHVKMALQEFLVKRQMDLGRRFHEMKYMRALLAVMKDRFLIEP